jgi:hypothetical protein
MNAAIQKAISLNNIAVYMMEAGSFKSAINNLYHSLKPFRDVSSSSEQQENETVRQRRSNLSIHQYMINSSSLERGTTSTSMDVDDDEEQQHFLYNHGIRIPGTIMDINYQECTLISCIVVFNLALAHHLYAEQVDKRSGTHQELLKAKELYEISLKMHRDISTIHGLDNEDCDDDDILFLLAIFNNLGLVHQQLQNNEKSGQCFEYVLSTLMCLADAGHNMKILDGFFINASTVISKPTAARAA